MPFPTTVRRPNRVTTSTATVVGSVLAAVTAVAAVGFVAPAPAEARTGAHTTARTSAKAPHATWVSRSGSWAKRAQASQRGRSVLRADSATGPTSVAAVPATLKDYLQSDRTDLQWALTSLHAQAAWGASRGDGVVVATVDTGADRTTPDLAGQLLPAVRLDPATDKIVAGYTADRVGHGTHVAGIIAGNDDGHGVTGIAPGAKVLPINVDTSDDLTGTQVAAAITYAVGHGAKVVNLSLGFSDITSGAADVKAICAAVSAAVAKKVVIVAAAGNDGMGTNNAEAPASCAGAISVAAVDNDLRPAVWSSYDRSVTVSAPGAAIYSTVTAATTPLRFSAESGTSMAAPYVSGLAALLLAQNPDWTPAQVSARITDTAYDLAPAGRDVRSGAGLIDPARALGVSAGDPTVVPAVSVAADLYSSKAVPVSRGDYDRVLLHWVPDADVPATGYRVTRWTSSGVTTTSYGPEVVRAVFPTGPAGYQVTALTADGDAASAPLWFPLPGQDPTPVYPVTGLKAAWTSSGGLTLRWTNPPRNTGVADEYAVTINGEVVLTAEKVAKLPSTAKVPASKVPAGDLVISVLVGSSSSLDYAETQARLAARVPFSGTAVGAGKGRYRVDLVLAPSRRSQCGSSRCTGSSVTVTSGGYATTTRIDSTGHAVVVVAARPNRGRITVGARVAGRPWLADRAVSVTVQ